MKRYRPHPPSRVIALAGATAAAAAMLAAVQIEAEPGVLVVAATGETTAHGPVVRLPAVEVTGRRPLEVALPDMIDRALDRLATRERPRPDA